MNQDTEQIRLQRENNLDSVFQGNRRQFFNAAAVAAAAGLIWPRHLLAEESELLSDKFGTLLPTRPFGKTGKRITILGIGGQHYRRLESADCQPAIEQSIEGGVRFFDTANNYGNNQLSERLYGQHLTPKYREQIFLMTKSAARDAAGAKDHLDRSLKNLNTDVIDLWQVHDLNTIEDVDRRWDNGAIDVFIKAREEGKVRYIGITGHKQPEVLLHMISKFKERGIPLQSAQFPVNVCDPAFSSFIEKVIPVCLENDIAVLAMKTMCGGRLFGGIGEGWGPRGQIDTKPVIPEFLSFIEATDFVWSLPITTRIAGFDNLAQLKENIEAARKVTAVSTERKKKILSAAKDHSGPDREYYKRNVLALDDPRERNF